MCGKSVTRQAATEQKTVIYVPRVPDATTEGLARAAAALRPSSAVATATRPRDGDSRPGAGAGTPRGGGGTAPETGTRQAEEAGTPRDGGHRRGGAGGAPRPRTDAGPDRGLGLEEGVAPEDTGGDLLVLSISSHRNIVPHWKCTEIMCCICLRPCVVSGSA